MAQAQACLQHAHQLAPNEDYILRHLQIVQTRITKLKAMPGTSKEKEIAFTEFDPVEYGGNVLNIKSNQNSIDMSEINSPPPSPKVEQEIIEKQSSSTKTKTVNATNKRKSEPIFIEADTMSSTIQDEYRLSNSGRTSINHGRYNMNSHVQSSSSSSSSNKKNNKKLTNSRKSSSSSSHRSSNSHSQKINKKVTDRDDPSSGMS